MSVRPFVHLMPGCSKTAFRTVSTCQTMSAESGASSLMACDIIPILADLDHNPLLLVSSNYGASGCLLDSSTVHIMKSSEPCDRSDHLGNSMSKLETDSHSKAYTQLSMLNHVVIIVISLLINHQCCTKG